MVKIDDNEVKRLAELAMLSLSEGEVKAMSKELKNIFKMIEEINKFDTSGVEQTDQVTGLQHVTREDKIDDYKVKPKDLVDAAAKKQDDQVEVPSVQ